MNKTASRMKILCYNCVSAFSCSHYLVIAFEGHIAALSGMQMTYRLYGNDIDDCIRASTFLLCWNLPDWLRVSLFSFPSFFFTTSVFQYKQYATTVAHMSVTAVDIQVVARFVKRNNMAWHKFIDHDCILKAVFDKLSLWRVNERRSSSHVSSSQILSCVSWACLVGKFCDLV